LTVIYDFEMQAKGEAHRLCNHHPHAQLVCRGRLRAQWAASAVQHGVSLDLGDELAFGGGWKMRQSRLDFRLALVA
jgi:hypothetical protein